MTPLDQIDQTPIKDINLYRAEEWPTPQEAKPSRRKLAGGLALLVVVLGSAIFYLLRPRENPLDVSQLTPKKLATPPASVFEKLNRVDPSQWLEYYDEATRTRLRYPPEATPQKREDLPVPASVAFKYSEPVVEVAPGAEKPGWLLAFGEIQDNSQVLSLRDWAIEKKLLSPVTAALDLILAGRPAISWRSAVINEVFYLVQRDDGVSLITVRIDSETAPKHQPTIDEIFLSLQFYPKDFDENLGFAWGRRKFGESWDLEVPASWSVDDRQVLAGRIGLTGLYDNQSYLLSFLYPLFDDFNPPGLPDSLDVWLQGDLSFLNADQLNGLKVQRIKVAGALAFKVVGLPELIADDGVNRQYGQNLILQTYIWKRGVKNPSLVSLKQVTGELDLAKMELLLDRFLKGIR